MTKLFSFFAIALMMFSFSPSESQAGWKIRGWYAPQVRCVMKKVTIRKGTGKVRVETIRVCR